MKKERKSHDRPAHTPDPWDVQEPLGDGPNKWIYADGLYIAEVDGEREEAEANARLIAAAPQLLSTLKDLLQDLKGAKELMMGHSYSDSWMVTEDGWNALIEHAERVITEAEGW